MCSSDLVREIGDAEALDAAVADAFEGARLSIERQDDRFEVWMHQPGLLRPLRARELSDGTLRYLLWVAALLSPRPAPLLVLNEPETSLHPDLLPALGRLIGHAARETQVFVVSHARRLLAALEDSAVDGAADGDGQVALALHKELGETHIDGGEHLDTPTWHWPGR